MHSSEILYLVLVVVGFGSFSAALFIGMLRTGARPYRERPPY